MGTGKTTLGERLAARLGWPLDDSDDAIVAAQGATVRELRDSLGTDAMHALEAQHLLAALARPRPRVVTPAAFTIEVPACRAALAGPGVAVVWLRGRPVMLAARFDAQAHRPRYGDEPSRFLAEQAARRDPLFASLATVAVDTDDRDPDGVLEATIGALRDARRWPGPDARAGAGRPRHGDGGTGPATV
jgi:shikimate kinase